jgi:very-short-patch-repair endonuclease
MERRYVCVNGHRHRVEQPVGVCVPGKIGGYCLSHSDVAKTRISKANKGRVLTDPAKTSTGVKRQWKDPEKRARLLVGGSRPEVIEAKRRGANHSGEGGCNCARHSRTSYTRSTKLALKMVELFLSEFPCVELEHRFGRYTVDAYLPPPYHLAFEADGEHWHKDKARDARRDQVLMDQFELPVVRFSEREIWSARWVN